MSKPERETETWVREVRIEYGGEVTPAEGPIRHPQNAARLFRKICLGDVERFAVVHLDQRHRPIGWQVVGVGTLTACLVHPREVFRAAIANRAAAILVGHNHPSGVAAASPEDRAMVQRLVEAGKVIGISVLDSLVVTETGHTSARDSGDLVKLTGGN